MSCREPRPSFSGWSKCHFYVGSVEREGIDGKGAQLMRPGLGFAYLGSKLSEPPTFRGKEGSCQVKGPVMPNLYNGLRFSKAK